MTVAPQPDLLVAGDYLPETVDVVRTFLDLNPTVSRGLILKYDAREEYIIRRLGCTAYYRQGVIACVAALCTQPGRGYSWPRLQSDRTELGVVAHELGHHVHLSGQEQVVRAIREQATHLRRWRVTSYEPNPDEIFAETFRLYVLNPDLLEQGRPARFRWMRALGLRSPTTVDWRTALGSAPRRFVERAERWIARRG